MTRPHAPSPRHVWLFAAALIVGTVYWLFDQPAVATAGSILWKGSAVAGLALWAAVNARTASGWWFTAVLAGCATGDMVLDAWGLRAGGVCFLIAYLGATAFYLVHRRRVRSASQTGLAILLLLLTPVIAFLLPADRAAAPGIAVYGLVVGGMAGAAWVSRFPRYRVGIGAVALVVSDLAIFAQIGPLAGSRLPHFLIWPLYLAGQALIAWGVVTTLARWRSDDELHHRL